MAVWTNDDLATIGEAEELALAPARRDGTLRLPRQVRPSLSVDREDRFARRTQQR
jgi:hypothetical protein